MPWQTPPVLHSDMLVEPSGEAPITLLNGAKLGPKVAACRLTLPYIGESSDAAATEQAHNKKMFDRRTVDLGSSEG